MKKIKETGVLFNGDMVRAIMDGSKTNTRRLMRPNTIKQLGYAAQIGEVSDFLNNEELHENDPAYIVQFSPYGGVVDRIWVPETWNYNDWTESGIPFIGYQSDGSVMLRKHPEDWADTVENIWCYLSRHENYSIDQTARDRKWRPSIHMPKWAARTWLEITEVKVQRLQDITEEEAIAEGIKYTDYGRTCFHQGRPQDVGLCTAPEFSHQTRPGWHWSNTTHQDQCYATAKYAFAALWISIYGQESWNVNPWVFAYSFKVINK